MLGGTTPIQMVLGAAPDPAAPLPILKSFAKAACDAGLHLLLIEPGGKAPVDMRSGVQTRRDNEAAQLEARQAGRKDWDKVKAKAGVYLATNDPVKLGRYLATYRKTYGEETPVNFAVAVGPSKLVVVDCDTAAQVTAFLTDVASATGMPLNPNVPPTVKSPGKLEADGTWSHSDGGHFYFTVEHPLPSGTGSFTAPGGYAMLWDGRYVLIPPSVRDEGPYRLTGQDFPAPDYIVAAVDRAVTARVARATESSPELATAVDRWAAAVSWTDLLAPAGWVPTSRPDQCGCDIWTAPGSHASPKSATAHDIGCTLDRYTAQNAPLHIWTDNPGPELEAWMAQHGSKTMSRLQVVAALEYGGNVGDAMRDLEVVPDDSESLSFGRDQDFELGISKSDMDRPLDLPPKEVDTSPFVSAGETASLATADDSGADEEDKPWPKGLPVIKPFSAWRDYPPPEFVIADLIEHRALTAVVGPPGVGKSGIVLDMAAHISLGQPWMGRQVLRERVLYLPGEGLSGAVQRLRAWEEAHDLDVGDDLFIGDSVLQFGASHEAWAMLVQMILEFEIGQVIVDTYARASVGLEENSATDAGRAIRRLDDVRHGTNAGVMIVHHTGKDGRTRGSSALGGALDTELTVREGTWHKDEDLEGRELDLLVTKQKNAAEPEDAIPLLAMPYGDSFVMTGPGGLTDDPMVDFHTVRAIIPEPLITTAIRLQEYTQRFPTAGITRAELAYGVPMDDYTARRADAKTAWKHRVTEAVDLALRYGMVTTTTGKDTGARLVPDLIGPESARERWSRETMAGD